MDEFHKITCMHYAAVRAEITGAVLDQTARKEHAREILGRNTDPGICLRILEKYVVTRLELLDEIILQKQRIRFRFNDCIFGICYLRDHHSRLACKPLGRDKILRDSLMQVFSLTHINHIPLSVIISIDTRGMRKQFYLIS